MSWKLAWSGKFEGRLFYDGLRGFVGVKFS